MRLGWVRLTSDHWGQSGQQMMMEGERQEEILAVEDDGGSGNLVGSNFTF